MDIQTVLNHFDGVQAGSTGQWKALCPAHDDHNPSLSITDKGDKILVHCQVGCRIESVIAAAGLTMADLSDRPQTVKRHVVKKTPYLYHNESGEPVFTSTRLDWNVGKKTFAINAVEGKIYDEVKHYPIRLPELLLSLKEHPDTPITIHEGEKCCNIAIEKYGQIATCNVGGARKWTDKHSQFLTGANVVIFPDNDSEGVNHKHIVAQSLKGIAKTVRVVTLPGLPAKGGIDDWKGTKEELDRLIASAPEYVEETLPIDAPVQEIKKQFYDISQMKWLSAEERNRESGIAVANWLLTQGKLFYTESKDLNEVMFFDNSRKILLPIKGDYFIAWLSFTLNINRAEKVFSFCLRQIETFGLSGRATQIELSYFWAHRKDAIYLSCGAGKIVKITAGNIQMVDNGTDSVLFRPSDCLESWNLVESVNPFETCSLFSNLSTSDKHGSLLFQLWALSLPTNQPTKPPLCVTGTVGSGKTRVIRGLFQLYGMPQCVANIKERDGDNDFWAVVDAGGLCCFDNCDTRTTWFTDSLEAAATGGTQDKKKLYTDKVKVSLKARAWVAVTSSNPSFASSPGLADRLIVIRLNRREGSTAENELTEEILKSRDAGLSWIASIHSKALSEKGTTPQKLNARHPDFAAYAVRIGSAMNLGEEAITALKACEIDKSLFNIENDVIGKLIFDLVQSEPFTGNAAELHAKLKDLEPSTMEHVTPQKLSKRIAKLWPHLKEICGAQEEKNSHSKTKVYIFAGDAGIQEVKTQNSLMEPLKNTFVEIAFESPQSPQNSRKDLHQVDAKCPKCNSSYYRHGNTCNVCGFPDIAIAAN